MVARDDNEDTRIYDVVMNHEEQYSVWNKGRRIPTGWHTVGVSGLKTECLAYIEQVWTDMRPLGLRHLDQRKAEQEPEARPSDVSFS